MRAKRLTRREFLRGAALTGAGLVAAACAPPATPPPPQIVKETVVVAGTPQIIEKVVTPTAAPTVAPTKRPPKDKIVVGMARPLSGPLAIIGDSAFKPIYETWVPRVNAQGGIYVKEYDKKLPIELKIYDDKSDVGTMTRLTEKLIVEDKVDFLWPAAGTAFVFAQTPIAPTYQYILITAEGGATSLKDMLP